MLWENLVFNELKKNGMLIPGRNFFFYRDQNGVEIDFIIEINNKIILIEAKSQELPNTSKLNFNKVSHLFKNKEKHCFLACMTIEEKLISLKSYGVFNPINFDLMEFVKK